MTYNEARKKATIKFIKKTYKQLVIRYKAEEYKFHIEPAIKESGLSVSSFIKTAVEEKIIRDYLHLEPEERPQNPVLSKSNDISFYSKDANLSGIRTDVDKTLKERQESLKADIDAFINDYNAAKETGKFKEFFEVKFRYIHWMSACWALSGWEREALPEEVKSLDDTARKLRFIGKDKAIEALDLMMENTRVYVKKERWDVVAALGGCLTIGLGSLCENECN